MKYELRYEGFPIDDDLHERLLLACRRFLIELGTDRPVQLLVKQIDGHVQGRVEVHLPGRWITALVQRADPVEALEAAMRTARDAITAAVDMDPTGTG